MAANENDVQVILREEKENPDGHEIRYSFAVHRTRSAEIKTFNLDFIATCDSPSVWNFQFYYEKVPATGKIYCSVTVNRKDSSEQIVQVFVLVTFLHANGEVARFSEAVCCGMMAAGDVLQGSIRDDDKSRLIEQEMTVRINVNICNCHRRR